jgi:cytochrome c biogenesis protein CcmG, thiol:disulfide interchange protein DsbE
LKWRSSATLCGVPAKRLAIGALGLAILALLVVGLVQLGSSDTSSPERLTLAQMRARLAGSPPPLAALHAQASAILSGGMPALRERLAALHGRAVVVNKWASWCEPCRAEFPVFQHASTSLGRQVAFIGIDSGDSSPGPARAFLYKFPVSYPSYYDPSGRIGAQITDSTFTPVTVVYGRRGGFYVHQGPYATVAELERDVRRYGLNG